MEKRQGNKVEEISVVEASTAAAIVASTYSPSDCRSRCALYVPTCKRRQLSAFNLMLGAQVICFLYSCMVFLPEDVFGGATQWVHSDANVTHYVNSSVQSTDVPAICLRVTICSEGPLEVVLLFGARGSAYMLFPQLVIIFLTKCHSLIVVLTYSAFSIQVDISDLHHIHTICGISIALFSSIHVACHFVRYGIRSDWSLIYGHVCGRSGLVAFVALVLTVSPMLQRPRFIRRCFAFESRMKMHVLFMVFGIGLMFHTTLCFGVMLSTILIYAMDWLCKTYWKTYKIESTEFERLPRGTQLTFQTPSSWKKNELGYINVLVPWLPDYKLKKQWHPFSVYAHPEKPGHSCIFACVVGDWTKALHSATRRKTVRPVWVQGPFVSPYTASVNFQNLIFVATGIGITPALSSISRLSAGRHLTLTWMCRDASLVKFYIETFNFQIMSHVLIFYTGKEPLQLADLPLNLNVIRGRPDMEQVLKQLIYITEVGSSMDGTLLRQSIDFRVKMHKASRDANALKLASVAMRIDSVLTSMLQDDGISAIELQALIMPTNQQSMDINDFETALLGISRAFEFTPKEMAEAFENFDGDKDGRVCITDLQTYIRKLEFHLVTDVDPLREALQPTARQRQCANENLDDSYTPYDVDERVSSILESLEYSSVEITDMVTESPDPAFVQFSESEEDTESGHIWEFAQVEAFVHNLPILESMPHANRCILATDLVLKEYVDNEELARAGDVGEEMFFLLEGYVIAKIGAAIVKEYQPKDYFGEAAMHVCAPRSATLIAKGSVKCLSLSVECFDKLGASVRNIFDKLFYTSEVAKTNALPGVNRSALKQLTDNISHIAWKLREMDVGETGLVTSDDFIAVLYQSNVPLQPSEVLTIVGLLANDRGLLDYEKLVADISNVGEKFGEYSSVPESVHSKFIDDMTAEQKQRWTVLYCGGSAPVINVLEKFKKQHGIELSIESFSW